MLTDNQIISKYGKPGTGIVSMTLPYPMRIAWDLAHSVTHIQCHTLVVVRLTGVFTDLLAHYGLPELQRLNIDIFGGCFNMRAKRGTEKKAVPEWSRHSWGIAIDLDPVRNGLKTPWRLAEFSKPEYAPMVEIFYKHGFFSLGKEKNYDGMHFETNE